VNWAICAPDEADEEHAPLCVEGTCVVCAAGLGKLTFCEKEKDLCGILKVRHCRQGWQEKVLWCTVLWCTVLYYMVHCTMMQCIRVHCTLVQVTIYHSA
jgi:hypothetical protein